MKHRTLILIVCMVVLLTLIALAATMHDVHFEPARSWYVAPRPQSQLSFRADQILTDGPVWEILLIWLAVVVYAVVFIILLPPHLRKRLLRQMLRVAAAVLIVLLAMRYRPLNLPEIAPNDVVQGVAGPPGGTANPVIPHFSAPSPPPWLVYALSLLVLWVIGALFWFAYRWWRRWQQDRGPGLQPLAEVARRSLSDLAVGRPWGDVVLETYARMNEVVGAKRGLQRASWATPREFAFRLTRAGLPEAAVSGLTQLFEAVRYGGRTSDPEDATRARTCLESIVQACGESV